MSKGYVLVDVDITDPTIFDEYRQKVPETVAAYDGRYLVRGGDPERLEGDRSARRVVLLEFETRERAREWYFSKAYQDVLPLRLRSSTAHAFLLNGTDPA